MMNEKDELLANLRNLSFDEAVSYQMHSRMFEILGYLSNISNEYLPKEEQEFLMRVKELSKELLNELHLILDFYEERHSEYKKKEIM